MITLGYCRICNDMEPVTSSGRCKRCWTKITGPKISKESWEEKNELEKQLFIKNIKNITETTNNTEEKIIEFKGNVISVLFKCFAYIIFFIAFLLGLIYRSSYSESISWLYWGVGFGSGMLFLGFGEIIHLLHSINSKINTK